MLLQVGTTGSPKCRAILMPVVSGICDLSLAVWDPLTMQGVVAV